jgi:hypothetical protein
MKQGFLLRGKTPIQEKSNNSMFVQESFGPLHDDRIGRPIYGWNILQLTRHGRRSDPWEDFTESMTSDQQHMMNKVKSHFAESLDNVKSKCNPYQGVPNLPFKTYSVPMNALGCYYGKYFKNYQIRMSENYFSWHDENPKSHLLRWTSIFLCPISGEIFFTGSWQTNNPLPTVDLPAGQNIPLSSHEGNPLNVDKSTLQATVARSFANCRVKQCRWMKTVKDAKHGAAAWAYDCFQYRSKCLVENPVSEGFKDTSVLQVAITGPIGNEIPYLEKEGIFTVPEFVPLAIRNCVEQRQEEIRIEALKCCGDIMDSEVIKELAWHSSKNHLERTKEGT